MMRKIFRWLFPYTFDFSFETKLRDPEGTATILNAVYSVDGFKELLLNDIYWYRRKAVESKELDVASIHFAEAYQRLLDKMMKSREYLQTLSEKREQEKERRARMEFDQYITRY